MKIVFTVASYYPQKDGVQYVTQYQAEGLARLGHEVVVITSNRFCKTKTELYNNVRIIRVDAYNKNMFHYGDKQDFHSIVMHETDNADALICVCLQSFAADWILPILDKIGCAKVLMMHGMHDFKWSKVDVSSIKNIARKVLRDIRWTIFYNYNWSKIKRFDSAIHLHEKDNAFVYFKKHNYKNNFVLYNAVDDELFVDNCIKKENIIINIGSYNSRKNQKLVMETFYKADTDNYSLVLIGNPQNDYYRMLNEYKKTLENKYGKKNTYIYCSMSRLETVEYIKKSKIYLCCSTWEAFPISVVEAMAAHMAIVSTNVGIVADLPGIKICSNECLADGLSGVIKEDLEKLSDEAYVYADSNLRQKKQIQLLEQIIKKTRAI